jgi:putative transcriptional regulator
VENTSRTYQYSECGLDYVYLVGGFEVRPTPFGDQLTIANQKGLHKAIGKYLITHKKELTGKEVRFLRHEMDMSQPTLAKLLGVTEQTVHKWEMGKTTQVPETASRMIRVIYGQSVGEKSPVRQVLRKISDLENELDELVTFIEKEQSWRQTRLKAA